MSMEQKGTRKKEHMVTLGKTAAEWLRIQYVENAVRPLHHFIWNSRSVRWKVCAVCVSGSGLQMRV